jgi:hypothetical protein
MPSRYGRRPSTSSSIARRSERLAAAASSTAEAPRLDPGEHEQLAARWALEAAAPDAERVTDLERRRPERAPAAAQEPGPGEMTAAPARTDRDRSLEHRVVEFAPGRRQCRARRPDLERIRLALNDPRRAGRAL